MSARLPSAAIRRALALLLALLLAGLAGCGLARQPLVPFAPSDAVVFGRVVRAGVPVAGELVKLLDANGVVLIDSVRTDAGGQYGFRTAPAGGVMVKVSSIEPGDWGYVRWPLTRASAAERDSVPPFDVWAFGCAPTQPAAGGHLPVPDPAVPVTFAWTAVGSLGAFKYKVGVSDSADALVWQSVRELGVTSTSFNGVGTDGALAGQLIPAGRYLWRVKVRLPNNVQAATVVWQVRFDPPGVRP